MRTVIQRVSSASVTIGGRVAGRVDRGVLVLLGVEEGDTGADAGWLARKVARLRIFPDEAGQMNRSLLDLAAGPAPSTGGAPPPLALVISQFTLHASTRKGNRPSFNRAAQPGLAGPLYRQFVALLSGELGRPVATGEFGAMMDVALVNDGPVTLVIDSRLRE